MKVAQLSSNSLWPHGLYSPWNSLGQNTGVGGLSLLQEIVPTQGSNPDLPHCRQILYQLSHKGSPRILEWVAFLFSSGSSQPRDLTGVSLIAGGFFTNWAIREAPDYTNWCVNHFFRMYCMQKTSSTIYKIRLSVYKGSLPHHRRILLAANCLLIKWDLPVAQMVKNLPVMQETRVRSLGWEDPLEKGMAMHSSILACRIPWTEEPGELQSVGSQTVAKTPTWLSN